jgi:DNA repair protein SbcC/Rad50
MRVHRLEVTAFGPFADTQVIDFEPLNAAGVFLLTGHTGAGKTSILDAICFGLFGQVPGVRDKAKTYRSHHAPPEVAPRVVLEVTLQGHRLRLTRQPVWSRPSRRAKSGSVEEKARATAEELVDGAWVTRSTRADEVGHLVSRLLGLNRDQFCQVVMLPQGEFQAFLRAGARERQHILETLFGTQRFQAVERWLVEHRRMQARRCRQHEEQVGRLVARLHEACSSAMPGLRLELAEMTADDPELIAGVRLAVESGADDVRVTHDRALGATRLAKHAVHALDEGRALAERRERHREARREHAALMAMRDVVAAREHRVRRARAAGTLEPLVAIARDARLAHERAQQDADSAFAPCTGPAGTPTTRLPSAAEARDLVTRLNGRVSRLESLASIELECDDLSERIAAEARAELASSIDDLRAKAAHDPGMVADLRTQVDSARGIVRRGVGSDERRRRALDALAAAHEVEAHDAARSTLDGRILEARETAARSTETWLDARERHLAGMAAELAGLLVDGERCPVCGSDSHPSPAMPAVPHVTAQQEAALLEHVTSQRQALATLEDELSAIVSARCEAVGRSRGLDTLQAATEADLAERDLREALAASLDHARLVAALDTLLGDAEARRTTLEDAATEAARMDERLGEWRRRLQSQQAKLAAELGEAGRLQDVLAKAAEAADRTRTLAAALGARDETGRSLRRAQKRLTTALGQCEFSDAAAVIAACLTPSEIASEEALARAHEVDLSTWSRVLSDPVLVAAAAEPAPDLERLESHSTAAEQAAASANGLAAAVDRRQSRLEELLSELEELVDGLVPLRAARDLADDLAGLCAGTSTDNATRTALSHYVLAARLSQVVAAANQRLDSIGGGRYQLEHTMTRGAGDTRGGLGLVVRDTHTDQGRDPATLSGGETFYVSLSLALGLADVVTTEAGGAELSTLFVDEGFGSLDDDTRDEVLDELDALRSGGRTVGLVSHLSELRARCPAQLHVVATARGSRCLPATGT